MVRFKRAKSLLLIILFLFSFFPQPWAGQNLIVIFRDVGEGEAIYLETPTDEKILVDTGNPISGHDVVDFLKKRGIRSLDAIFITHPHPDHMGGIFHILPRFDVGSVYDNGQPIPENPDSEIYRWYEEAVRYGNYSAVKAGDLFQYGDVKIQVLWPRSPLSSDWNANSLVLKVVYGDVAFLLMGDANTFVENALLDAKVDLRAQVLKVGHHGAADATSKEFLERVSPAYAVISINDDNIRGYPDTEVVKRLEDKGIEIFFTYHDGDIEFILNRQGILQPFKENPSALILDKSTIHGR
jgi:competence protein ComEC